jgi:predicted GNAT superfamily acetyltransferase
MPVPGQTVLIGIPADIEGLRVSDPVLAAAWRSALREALAPLLDVGAIVTGFDRDGWYVVSPAGRTEAGERASQRRVGH